MYKPLELKVTCDINHGFVFDSAKKTAFGFVHSLKFGDQKNIAADIVAADPLHESASVMPLKPGVKEHRRGQVFTKPVVGVLKELSWGGGPSDYLRLSFFVSVDNWGKLDLFFRTDIDTSTKVAFCVALYKWDYVQNAYFVRFCTNGTASSGSSKVTKKAATQTPK